MPSANAAVAGADGKKIVLFDFEAGPRGRAVAIAAGIGASAVSGPDTLVAEGADIILNR